AEVDSAQAGGQAPADCSVESIGPRSMAEPSASLWTSVAFANAARETRPGPDSLGRRSASTFALGWSPGWSPGPGLASIDGHGASWRTSCSLAAETVGREA